MKSLFSKFWICNKIINLKQQSNDEMAVFISEGAVTILERTALKIWEAIRDE